MRGKNLIALPVIGALLALPLLIESPYALHLFVLLFSAVILGGSWNVIGGWAGQYSVGHAAYFGVGAYVTMILLQKGIAPWFGIWPAILAALIVALVIGSICFRLRGPYFVLASIAVAEIMRNTALNWKDLTNGAEGILSSDVPPLKIFDVLITDFSTKVPFYYVGLVVASLVVALNIWVGRSKLGYYLQAIREDQDAAHSLGISLAFYKNVGLLLSAGFTALAGGFYGVYISFIDPATVFGIDISLQAVLVCIVGGIGTVMGPVIGALVLVLLSEALRANLLAELLFKLGLQEDSATGAFLKENLAHAHLLIYGVMVVLVILYMPDGVLGAIRRVGARRARGAPVATGPSVTS